MRTTLLLAARYLFKDMLSPERNYTQIFKLSVPFLAAVLLLFHRDDAGVGRCTWCVPQPTAAVPCRRGGDGGQGASIENPRQTIHITRIVLAPLPPLPRPGASVRRQAFLADEILCYRKQHLRVYYTQQHIEKFIIHSPELSWAKCVWWLDRGRSAEAFGCQCHCPLANTRCESPSRTQLTRKSRQQLCAPSSSAIMVTIQLHNSKANSWRAKIKYWNESWWMCSSSGWAFIYCSSAAGMVYVNIFRDSFIVENCVCRGSMKAVNLFEIVFYGSRFGLSARDCKMTLSRAINEYNESGTDCGQWDFDAV